MIIDKDQALKDYVRVSINLFAPRLEEDFDMSIAESLCLNSLAHCYGKEIPQVKALVREIGDYGDVAVSLKRDEAR